MTDAPEKITLTPNHLYGSPWSHAYICDNDPMEDGEDTSYGYTRDDISDMRIEILEDEKDYLQAELSMAIKTAFHRGAVEWTKLNYPKMYKSLKENN
jgi:hypothetical protein